METLIYKLTKNTDFFIFSAGVYKLVHEVVVESPFDFCYLKKAVVSNKKLFLW